ncbi:cobyrinate a,c-diamide synthase [Clostridium sp. HBUAS56017]|uniref:cobyrinate a,c-diamide synthase n=1 Tax=Clostridium sp. HBUAS56017 TaxID=2571128 RepID=UPI00325BED4C
MGRSPRVMIAATSSGSGKTMITCGLLQALVNRRMKVTSFKCGPDYIDPMFHSKVIGTKSRNIDTFFADKNTIYYLMNKATKDMDISVIEGVMGYYDGLAGISTEASSYDVANATNTPVVLVVNCRGMSLSILPIIKGFLEFKENSCIKGVILNQISEMMYPQIKKLIEENLSIKVFGYVPVLKDLVIESRHLGLVTPNEITDLKEKLNKLSDQFEKTININEIINLANSAKELEYNKPQVLKLEGNPKVAVAYDEAFCFYYQENIELLKEMGATVEYFSPIRDKKLPKNISGLILGGGYPELYAEALSNNKAMLEEIKYAIDKGLPCIAECGGFMYLHESMEDNENKFHNMVGVIGGKTYKTSNLGRFGYINLKAIKDNFLCNKGSSIKAHEFHYWDSESSGESFIAEKPLRKRSWNCINSTNNLLAGFPHLYYYSNTEIPQEFIKRCIEFGGLS